MTASPLPNTGEENSIVDALEPKDGRRPFALDGRQKTLVEALSEKDARLGQMYVGALMVLENQDNPESLAQACHSLRELMEKIPRWYEAVPAPEQVPRLNDRVRALEKRWKSARNKTKCISDGKWGGTIDRALAIALAAIEDFFGQIANDMPMRKERTAGMFRKLDPLRLPLPTRIEELRVREWSDCRDYLIEVAHHNAPTAPEELAKWLYFLEGFLLDLIRPRTFEKHKDIDEIVEQGERNADPR
jgi:hypothetical protein